MAIQNVPNPVTPVPNMGYGPSYGVGVNPSEYVGEVMVGGTPSVQPDMIIRAPAHAYNYGEIAQLQGPYQHGFVDLYSFRVHSPAIPLRTLPVDEVAYQVFRNGQLAGHGLILGAPNIPTGGYTPSSVKGR